MAEIKGRSKALPIQADRPRLSGALGWYGGPLFWETFCDGTVLEITLNKKALKQQIGFFLALSVAGPVALAYLLSRYSHWTASVIAAVDRDGAGQEKWKENREGERWGGDEICELMLIFDEQAQEYALPVAGAQDPKELISCCEMIKGVTGVMWRRLDEPLGLLRDPWRNQSG